MAKKLISSVLALAMCFCMAFGVLPVSSFADETGIDNCPVVEASDTRLSEHNKDTHQPEAGDPNPGIEGESYTQRH